MLTSGGLPRPAWRRSTSRRTSSTGCLNHVSGTIRGVAAVYNRHAYLDERKAALAAWSRYVEQLVRAADSEGNIVQIPARRG